MGETRVGVQSVAVRTEEPRTEERCALRNAQTFVLPAPTRIKAMLTKKKCIIEIHKNSWISQMFPSIGISFTKQNITNDTFREGSRKRHSREKLVNDSLHERQLQNGGNTTVRCVQT